MDLYDGMLNFTVGPVMSSSNVLDVAGCSSPYFRTPEFSDVLLENEKLMLEFLNAPKDSRCVFLTTSGTGAMESVVMNVLREDDKVLVVNGGSFGQRFFELSVLHGYDTTEIKLNFGENLKKEQLNKFRNCGYTALLINMHETSSGNLYDMKMVGEFCKENNILLIVDAISAFIADELDMSQIGAAVVLTGSQKALAVQPGISIIALSRTALSRIDCNREKCLYLSLKEAIKNAERGQTPFTPAVTVLFQINARLAQIKRDGGIAIETKRIAGIAEEFREFIKDMPFEIVSDNPSNAVTCLHPLIDSASEIISVFKDKYRIWLCPNGGEYKDKYFRVGHIGYITDADMDRLETAFLEYCGRK